MAKVKIGLAYRAPSFTADRFGKFDWVIPYTIDANKSIFEIRMPEEDFTPQKGEQAVTAAAHKAIALMGKELTI